MHARAFAPQALGELQSGPSCKLRRARFHVPLEPGGLHRGQHQRATPAPTTARLDAGVAQLELLHWARVVRALALQDLGGLLQGPLRKIRRVHSSVTLVRGELRKELHRSAKRAAVPVQQELGAASLEAAHRCRHVQTPAPPGRGALSREQRPKCRPVQTPVLEGPGVYQAGLHLRVKDALASVPLEHIVMRRSQVKPRSRALVRIHARQARTAMFHSLDR